MRQRRRQRREEAAEIERVKQRVKFRPPRSRAQVAEERAAFERRQLRTFRDVQGKHEAFERKASNVFCCSAALDVTRPSAAAPKQKQKQNESEVESPKQTLESAYEWTDPSACPYCVPGHTEVWCPFHLRAGAGADARKSRLAVFAKMDHVHAISWADRGDDDDDDDDDDNDDDDNDDALVDFDSDQDQDSDQEQDKKQAISDGNQEQEAQEAVEKEGMPPPSVQAQSTFMSLEAYKALMS